MRPAILISDHNLPGGMSGPALCRKLQEVLPRAVPAIVLTGDPSPRTAREIAEVGAEHVRKPVGPEKLAALMQRLLEYEPGDAATPVPTPTADLAELEPGRAEAMVHVVDDDPSVRKAMQALLRRLGYGVETYPTAEAFLATYRPRGLECLLVDMSMPGMNGLQVQEALHDRGAAVPVIIITGRQEVPLAVQAMRAGAVDFLEKPVSGERLLEALERALSSSTRKAEAAKARAEIEGRFARLTAREREVLDLIIDGLANKEVAARLGISPRTAENHRARVMEKTGARSLAELVRISLGAGTSAPAPAPSGARIPLAGAE